MGDTIDLRREYELKKLNYQRLLDLVTLILNSAIEKNHLKIHSIKSRVKAYDNFLEKIERKGYNDPFRECTDLAGCRIICLFHSQVEEIKKIIENEFQVIEITDKKTAKKFDQFGYLSLHMLIKIPKNRSEFIEFSGLEDFVCEVQIRTILQEAWAEIEHYLNYKTTKEEKNQELLRKIFSLAGMFEVADSTFEEIHKEFKRMIEQRPIRQELTALNLFKFCQKYFSYKTEWTKKHERAYLRLNQDIKTLGITSIAKIEHLLNKYKGELNKLQTNKEYQQPIKLIRAALALEFGGQIDVVFGQKGYSANVRNSLK